MASASCTRRCRSPLGCRSGLWVARGGLALQGGRCSVVHAHGLNPGLIASTIRSRPPLVTTVRSLVHDESAGHLAAVLRRFDALLPRRSDRVIAVLSRSRTGSPRWAAAGRIVVIPPVSDLPKAVPPRAEVRAGLESTSRTPLVVCVERLHPHSAREARWY